MQRLYCLGSLCHLTAVWSQQKSTIFAFQQFSPTVSLCRVWKCDQWAVYQFTLWRKWLKLGVWFVGGLTTRSSRGVHCCRRANVIDSYGAEKAVGKLGRRGCRKSLGSDLLGCDSHQSTECGPSSVKPPKPQKVTEGRREGDHQIEGLRERKWERCDQCQTNTGSPKLSWLQFDSFFNRVGYQCQFFYTFFEEYKHAL